MIDLYRRYLHHAEVLCVAEDGVRGGELRELEDSDAGRDPQGVLQEGLHHPSLSGGDQKSRLQTSNPHPDFQAYPNCEIDDVQIAYSVAKLCSLNEKLETAQRAIAFCENYQRSQCKNICDLLICDLTNIAGNPVKT